MIDELCKVVLDELKINKFLETGLFEAETIALVARWFAELHPDFGHIERLELTDAKGVNPWNTRIAYPAFSKAEEGRHKIYSVELDRGYAERAQKLFANNPNIEIACESSEEFLARFVDSEVADGDRCFFYLDAHWNEYWPLLDEIRSIGRLDRHVIAIDDFLVPGRPEFGFDLYENTPCSWATVKELFEGERVAVYYPHRSNRDNRGWIWIFKGYSSDELTFLSSVPVWRASPQDLRDGGDRGRRPYGRRQRLLRAVRRRLLGSG